MQRWWRQWMPPREKDNNFHSFCRVKIESNHFSRIDHDRRLSPLQWQGGGTWKALSLDISPLDFTEKQKIVKLYLLRCSRLGRDLEGRRSAAWEESISRPNLPVQNNPFYMEIVWNNFSVHVICSGCHGAMGIHINRQDGTNGRTFQM